MKNSTTSGQPPRPSNNYSPSVPISVYRELAAELQSTQTQLDTLKNQNQQLLKHNQQLRIEIERVVQSALQMRQSADAFQPSGWAVAPDTSEAEPETLVEPSRTTPRSPAPRSQAPRTQAPKVEVLEPSALKSHPLKSTPPRIELVEPSIPVEDLFIEQESQPRRMPQSERGLDLGGWWLAGVILLIIVTAFGTGFLIVRPLLSPSR